MQTFYASLDPLLEMSSATGDRVLPGFGIIKLVGSSYNGNISGSARKCPRHYQDASSERRKMGEKNPSRNAKVRECSIFSKRTWDSGNRTIDFRLAKMFSLLRCFLLFFCDLNSIIQTRMSISVESVQVLFMVVFILNWGHWLLDASSNSFSHNLHLMYGKCIFRLSARPSQIRLSKHHRQKLSPFRIPSRCEEWWEREWIKCWESQLWRVRSPNNRGWFPSLSVKFIYLRARLSNKSGKVRECLLISRHHPSIRAEWEKAD